MKYKAEIDKVFEDALRDPWDTDEEWAVFKEAVSKHFKYEDMDKAIEEGIKNGHSLERQMEICRQILSEMKYDDDINYKSADK